MVAPGAADSHSATIGTSNFPVSSAVDSRPHCSGQSSHGFAKRHLAAEIFPDALVSLIAATAAA